MPTVSTVPSDDACEVPGCQQPKAKEDCCKTHGRANGSSDQSLANDGIIDWLAIDLAVNNERLPRLSWIERDIAAAAMLSRGVAPKEIENRLGINYWSKKRQERIAGIAEAITKEGLRACA